MVFDYVIFNGALVPIEQAKISIFNPAIFSSFGIYETIKVDRGRPFYLEQHLLRLLESAQMIGLELQIEIATLIDWFESLLKIDDKTSWSLRIIVIGAMENGAAPIIAMQPMPLPVYPPQYYRRGVGATLYEGQRVMPKCKSLNNLINYLARREAKQAGTLEGLLHHDGYLTEGARSNLFGVRHGQLITPPTEIVLSGITRDVILDVMRETDHPVIETMLPVDIDLYDEFFISSTSMHVIPVTRIDRIPVGNGQVGPVTRNVMSQFEAHYNKVIGD